MVLFQIVYAEAWFAIIDVLQLVEKLILVVQNRVDSVFKVEWLHFEE